MSPFFLVPGFFRPPVVADGPSEVLVARHMYKRAGRDRPIFRVGAHRPPRTEGPTRYLSDQLDCHGLTPAGRRIQKSTLAIWLVLLDCQGHASAGAADRRAVGGTRLRARCDEIREPAAFDRLPGSACAGRGRQKCFPRYLSGVVRLPGLAMSAAGGKIVISGTCLVCPIARGSPSPALQ